MTKQAALSAKLACLTENKRCIPLICTYPNLTITDVKLPELLLTNTGAAPFTLTALEVAGYAGGAQVVSHTPAIEHLHTLMRQSLPQIRELLAGDPESLMLWVGKLAVDNMHLCDGEVVPPGQCAILMLNHLLMLHHVGLEPLDALEIRVTLEGDGTQEMVALSVLLLRWESAVAYRFPIRGLVQIGNMAWNYLHHRQALSQEFGFDITGLELTGTDCLVSHHGDALEDYPIYRRPVYAVADGEVVEAADEYPEEMTVPPETWTKEASAARFEELITRIGRRNAVAGNYLVIRHSPGEFAFYAHLSQHSQRVAVGDVVTAGQPIALVGSTGNSSEPHLHFHLMDNTDIFAANGLPIAFIDISATQLNQFYTTADALTAVDTLMVTISND